MTTLKLFAYVYSLAVTIMAQALTKFQKQAGHSKTKRKELSTTKALINTHVKQLNLEVKHGQHQHSAITVELFEPKLAVHKPELSLKNSHRDEHFNLSSAQLALAQTTAHTVEFAQATLNNSKPTHNVDSAHNLETHLLAHHTAPDKLSATLDSAYSHSLPRFAQNITNTTQPYLALARLNNSLISSQNKSFLTRLIQSNPVLNSWHALDFISSSHLSLQQVPYQQPQPACQPHMHLIQEKHLYPKQKHSNSTDNKNLLNSTSSHQPCVNLDVNTANNLDHLYFVEQHINQLLAEVSPLLSCRLSVDKLTGTINLLPDWRDCAPVAMLFDFLQQQQPMHLQDCWHFVTGYAPLNLNHPDSNTAIFNTPELINPNLNTTNLAKPTQDLTTQNLNTTNLTSNTLDLTTKNLNDSNLATTAPNTSDLATTAPNSSGLANSMPNTLDLTSSHSTQHSAHIPPYSATTTDEQLYFALMQKTEINSLTRQRLLNTLTQQLVAPPTLTQAPLAQSCPHTPQQQAQDFRPALNKSPVSPLPPALTYLNSTSWHQSKLCPETSTHHISALTHNAHTATLTKSSHTQSQPWSQEGNTQSQPWSQDSGTQTQLWPQEGNTQTKSWSRDSYIAPASDNTSTNTLYAHNKPWVKSSHSPRNLLDRTSIKALPQWPQSPLHIEVPTLAPIDTTVNQTVLVPDFNDGTYHANVDCSYWHYDVLDLQELALNERVAADVLNTTVQTTELVATSSFMTLFCQCPNEPYAYTYQGLRLPEQNFTQLNVTPQPFSHLLQAVQSAHSQYKHNSLPTSANPAIDQSVSLESNNLAISSLATTLHCPVLSFTLEQPSYGLTTCSQLALTLEQISHIPHHAWLYAPCYPACAYQQPCAVDIATVYGANCAATLLFNPELINLPQIESKHNLQTSKVSITPNAIKSMVNADTSLNLQVSPQWIYPQISHTTPPASLINLNADLAKPATNTAVNLTKPTTTNTALNLDKSATGLTTPSANFAQPIALNLAKTSQYISWSREVLDAITQCKTTQYVSHSTPAIPHNCIKNLPWPVAHSLGFALTQFSYTPVPNYLTNTVYVATYSPQFHTLVPTVCPQDTISYQLNFAWPNSVAALHNAFASYTLNPCANYANATLCFNQQTTWSTAREIDKPYIPYQHSPQESPLDHIPLTQELHDRAACGLKNTQWPASHISPEPRALSPQEESWFALVVLSSKTLPQIKTLLAQSLGQAAALSLSQHVHVVPTIDHLAPLGLSVQDLSPWSALPQQLAQYGLELNPKLTQVLPHTLQIVSPASKVIHPQHALAGDVYLQYTCNEQSVSPLAPWAGTDLYGATYTTLTKHQLDNLSPHLSNVSPQQQACSLAQSLYLSGVAQGKIAYSLHLPHTLPLSAKRTYWQQRVLHELSRLPHTRILGVAYGLCFDYVEVMFLHDFAQCLQELSLFFSHRPRFFKEAYYLADYQELHPLSLTKKFTS